jgi:hypothetical protein
MRPSYLNGPGAALARIKFLHLNAVTAERQQLARGDVFLFRNLPKGEFSSVASGGSPPECWVSRIDPAKAVLA